MRRLIMVMAVLLFALTAGAQYDECERCETSWEVIPLPTFTGSCTTKYVVFRSAQCEDAPAAYASYENCTTERYSECGHSNPFIGDAGPCTPSMSVCCDRRTDMDEHCHVSTNCNTNEPPPGSPLVINFGKRWDFTGEDDPVSFDLLGNGTPQLWTWMARDTDQAFLALDHNGDGQINGGQELLGDYNPDPHSGTINGFDALRQYAGDDRYVMDDDPVWPKLQLWFDRNHDAISQAEELKYVATYVHPRAGRIWALDTEYRKSDREDGDGNKFLYKSRVHFVKDGRLTVEKYFDIYFVMVP